MPGFEIIGKEEQQAVDQVFKNGGCLFRYGFEFMRKNTYKVIEFEKVFTRFTGSKYAQAVSSGTAALFAVNKALGIGPGDEVITQSFTFVATIEAIVETGATPVITEVDETLNMDPKDLEKKITKKTKAIWVVHMLGVSAKMNEILAISKKYNIPVLEDTAQSLGAKYNKKYCGILGKAGTFSFDFGKTLTTGEGGMIVTDSKQLYLKVKAYSDHGHEDNPKFPRGEDIATSSGFSFRMMELQGAIGIVQLKKLSKALQIIRKNNKKLRLYLGDIKTIAYRKVPKEGLEVGDCLIFFLETESKRKKVSDFLAKREVGFKLLPGAVKWHFAGRFDHIWKNVPSYAGKDYLKLWPKSYNLLMRAIAIPIMINMPEKRIQFIANSIKEAINHAV